MILLSTDDDRAMGSLLVGKVDKLCDSVELEHHTQHSGSTRFFLNPSSIPDFVKFLQQCETYIASGYKESLKPQEVDELHGNAPNYFPTYKPCP